MRKIYFILCLVVLLFPVVSIIFGNTVQAEVENINISLNFGKNHPWVFPG